ncbi:MAG TPA: GNAT family N-acetyltransferase [Stellaceae bacterium]|nr:GNAT family N-acetyltransferase [Stellaceae bacterium]
MRRAYVLPMSHSINKISIRAVSASDFALACALLVRFFAEEGFTTPPDKISANLRTMIGDPFCWAAMAWAGDEAVGITTISTNRGVEFGLQGEIGDLYVVPAARGHGIARALVNASLAWCRERGCASVQVVITPEGQGAHDLLGFYERLGFAPTGRTLVLYELQLPPR